MVQEFLRYIEGTASCGSISQIGGDGVIMVEGELTFADYMPGSTE